MSGTRRTDRKGSTKDRKRGSRRRRRRDAAGESQHPQADLNATLATVAAWLGLTLALVDLYPELFPWQTHSQRLLGSAICCLVAALAARMSYLTALRRLDRSVVLLMTILLITIALDAMSVPVRAGI